MIGLHLPDFGNVACRSNPLKFENPCAGVRRRSLQAARKPYGEPFRVLLQPPALVCPPFGGRYGKLRDRRTLLAIAFQRILYSREGVLEIRNRSSHRGFSNNRSFGAGQTRLL